MELVEKLISENHRDEFSATSGKPNISPSPLRLTLGHFPDVMPATEKSQIQRHSFTGDCVPVKDILEVLDESRSFFRVHTGYFSNIPKCIKAEFIASWACSQSSVVSSSKR
ncbi:hypothetical protein TNCV_2792921 [Trichonephila clavipes]|nr:hypothetical protein TNCV_2792921 [Trichonephila clavipes]